MKMKPPPGFYDPPEDGDFCPICNYAVDLRRELWGYTADWQVCHEKCLQCEREDSEYGCQETG